MLLRYQCSADSIIDTCESLRDGDHVFGMHRVNWSNHRRLLKQIGDIWPAEFEQAYYDRLVGHTLAP